MPFRANFADVSTFLWITAGVVFAAVVVTMTVALVAFRARPGRPANQNTEHTRIEASYAGVILLVALGIYAYTYTVNNSDFVPRKPAMTVAVTGYQWCWQFHYVGTPVTVQASCRAGHYPDLVLPVGERIRFTVTSRDVMHSFWLPYLRFKMDAFPDHVNTFEATMPSVGHWLGHCAELCGLYHADMLFDVQTMPRARFRTWLRDAEAAVAHSPSGTVTALTRRGHRGAVRLAGGPHPDRSDRPGLLADGPHPDRPGLLADGRTAAPRPRHGATPASTGGPA